MVTTQQLISEVVVKDSASAVADRVSQAMDRMAASEGKAQAGATQLNAGLATSSRALEGHARSFENLKRSVDPVYDSQVRLANAQSKLSGAVAAGAASQAEATLVLGRFKASLAEAPDRIEGLRHKIGLFADTARGDFGGAARAAAMVANEYGLLSGAVLAPVAGVIALGAALAGVAIASLKVQNEIDRVNTAIRATGSASGQTRGSIEAMARALDASTTLSRSGARESATALLSGGKIGGANFQNILGLVPDYAKVTGDSADKAAASLNRLFSDPAKGAKELDAALNLLSTSQLRDIENLQAQGRLSDAQATLETVLAQRIKGTSTEVGYLARAWEAVTKGASDAWDVLGHIGASQSLDQQIEAAQRQLQASNNRAQPFTGILPRANPAIAAKDDLDRLLKQRDDANRAAAKGGQDAADRATESAADAAVRAQDPLIAKREELTNKSVALFAAIQGGVGDVNAESRAFRGLTAAISNLLSPVNEAKKRLADAQQVARAPIPARPALQAQLNAQRAAERNPETAADAGRIGALAGQTAQVGVNDATQKAIDQAGLAADAQQRLASASAVGSDAMRAAATANATAAFAFEHGAAAARKYGEEIARAGAASRVQEFNALTLSLDQQADAEARLAVAAANGPAAFHSAQIEAKAFADALKFGAQGSDAFATAYDRLLASLRRQDAASITAAAGQEINRQQEQLQLSQMQLAMAGQNVDVRNQELALLRERLTIERQFPGIDDAQRDQLLAIASAQGKINAQLEEAAQKTQQWAQLTKQIGSDIADDITALVTRSSSMKDLKKTADEQLTKLASTYFISDPIKSFLDKGLGSQGLAGLFFGGTSGSASTSSSSATAQSTIMSAITKLFGGSAGGGPGVGASGTLSQQVGSASIEIGVATISGAITSAQSVAQAASSNGGVFDQISKLITGGNSALTKSQAASGDSDAQAAVKSGTAGGGGLFGWLSNLFGGGGGLVSSGSSLSGFAAATPEAMGAGAVLHGGGIIGYGGTTRTGVPLAVWSNAPRAHTGLDLGHDEVPIIGLRGERVLNRQETAAYNAGGGGGETHVHIHHHYGDSRPNPQTLDRANRTGTQSGLRVLGTAASKASRLG